MDIFHITITSWALYFPKVGWWVIRREYTPNTNLSANESELHTASPGRVHNRLCLQSPFQLLMFFTFSSFFRCKSFWRSLLIVVFCNLQWQNIAIKITDDIISQISYSSILGILVIPVYSNWCASISNTVVVFGLYTTNFNSSFMQSDLKPHL